MGVEKSVLIGGFGVEKYRKLIIIIKTVFSARSFSFLCKLAHVVRHIWKGRVHGRDEIVRDEIKLEGFSVKPQGFI